MENARHHLQLAHDLLTHTIRHQRDALARTKNTTHTHSIRQALKDALYANRQIRGHLDIVATRLDRPADQDT